MTHPSLLLISCEQPILLCCPVKGEGPDGADGCVTAEDIKDACADIVDANQQDNCKFDVRTTGNEDFGKAPLDLEPDPPLADSWCEQTKN